MYSATKKTRQINSFIRTSVLSPRDLYAKYGMRYSTNSIHGSDGTSPGTVVPQGSSMIEQVIRGQEELRKSTSKSGTEQ